MSKYKINWVNIEAGMTFPELDGWEPDSQIVVQFWRWKSHLSINQKYEYFNVTQSSLSRLLRVLEHLREEWQAVEDEMKRLREERRDNLFMGELPY